MRGREQRWCVDDSRRHSSFEPVPETRTGALPISGSAREANGIGLERGKLFACALVFRLVLVFAQDMMAGKRERDGPMTIQSFRRHPPFFWSVSQHRLTCW